MDSGQVGVEVKICGLRTEATLDAALAAGADYVGLVFYAPSPRNVAPEAARELRIKARGRSRSVALVVDADDALLGDILAIVDPDLIQLHGAESPERVRAVRAMAGRPVIKAVSVADADDVRAASRYDGIADFILFDAKPVCRAGGALPGGNGLRFEWGLLDAVKHRASFMLSGGLNPDNVAQAVSVTGACAVDVSSGVERAPGEKDPDLIRRFIRAAKSAG